MEGSPISSWGSRPKKGCTQQQESPTWSLRGQLGRPLQSEGHIVERYLQTRGPRWKARSKTLERGASEEVLSVAAGYID